MPLLQAAVIGLAALIIAPGSLFYFDVTPKLLVLLLGAAACAVFWNRGQPAVSFSAVLLASAVWLGVASALSTNPGLSIFGSTWRRFGTVAQVAVLVLTWLIAQNSQRGRTIVLRGISAACAIAAIYGIAQYLGFDPWLPKSGYHIGEGKWTIVRPPGTMGYVSYFATLLLVGGFLSLALARAEARTGLRRLAYAGGALCFAAMALTGTRAALLGFAAGAVSAAFLGELRVSRRMVLAAALVGIAGTAFYFSPFGWNLRSRARWFREDPWGGARMLLWRDSFYMAVKRPLVGFGLEVFTGTFPQFESRELARAYPDFAHESPHNIFLDAFVSEGLPGLACLMAVCGMGLLAVRRTRKPWLGAALVAGIVAQQFTAFTIPTALLFYAVIALSVARDTVPEAARLASWARVPATAVAGVMVYLALRYATADHSLELTRQQLASGDLAKAQVCYRHYQRARLPGASADLWYARSLLALSQTGEPPRRLQALWMAKDAALQAAQSAEDPFDAWYTFAEINAAENDAANTEAGLRRAIAANPAWFKPHWTLAQLLRLRGRASEAVAEAAVAADLDGGKHPEVAQTLAQIRALHR